MMVSPKAIKENEKGLATQPVGAGPFELTNYTAPTSATLVRNPGYWDAKDIHLEGVDLKFFTDEQALLSSLLSNQVQLANIGGEQVQTAESAGFEVSEFPSLHVASIEVNDKMGPFGDTNSSKPSTTRSTAKPCCRRSRADTAKSTTRRSRPATAPTTNQSPTTTPMTLKKPKRC